MKADLKSDLRQKLKEAIIVGDGAMGTYLYQLGFPIGVSYEEFNLLKPDIIMDVHRRYYEAGARLIETNTFSANREKLSKYGLENEVAAINRAGVQIARQAVGKDAYVVGAVGSIRAGKRTNISSNQIEFDLQQQIEALIEAEIDGVLLETFYDFAEMKTALGLIRKVCDLPVICQFATEGNGLTRDGVLFTEAFQQLQENGADVIGFNCHSGPNGILRALEKLVSHFTMPFSVFPNAGLPGYIDGRFTYMAAPEYFAETALQFADLGVRIIGGCCGTTPEHIGAMVKALNGYVPQQNTLKLEKNELSGSSLIVIGESKLSDKQLAVELPLAEPSILELVQKRHTVIVEWDSPRDLAINKFMQGSQALKDAGADAVTLADNSLAQTRISNMSMGHLIKDRLGIRPLLHVACRDRNLIGTQSHLMGLHALGINHVLAITGDPARVGDLPGSSSVYDLTSFDLIRMTKQLNEGVAFSGKLLKQKANFIVGAAFDPNVKYMDKGVQRMEKKVAAGADYFMTQPVFDPLQIEKFYMASKHLNVPIFIGIMPLMSGRNAEFLHNEVPGIRISEEIRKRMANLEGEAGRKMGIVIAKELVDVAMRYFKGIYFMTPMIFYDMTVELTQYVWKKSNRSDLPLYPSSK
ncbi:MAG: homocysteine methyltransferase [Bacilli bacterium]|jgi:methionine synthase I (cobalamin-dependent)/5,10-methylenetetrahydrofolate reductase|nr:homocysteine methyltransferase [Bacilli bacterium]